jgi:Tol biopolymer transport system component
VSRGLLVAVALTLAFGTTAAARTGGPAEQPKTLATVPGPVVALAHNGRHIAWIRRAKSVQVLALPGRHPTLLRSRRPPGCQCLLLNPVAVSADGRVLWQRLTNAGNTYYTLSALTASRRAPRARLLEGTYMEIESGNPDWVDPVFRGLPLAADGNVMLFYADCHAGQLCSYGPRVPAGIYRVTPRRSKLLVKVTSPAALAVSGRRFAVVTNSFRCCSFMPAWSHDATRIAWIYNGGLWTIRADGTGDRQLGARVSPPHFSQDFLGRPSWSPDDTRLVFERTEPGVGGPRSRGVYRVDAAGGGLRRLTAGSGPAWSPDGTKIASLRGAHVFTVKPDGTGAAKLTTVARATVGPLSWSPDSTRIAVSRGGDIYAVRADGGGETRLTTSSRRETKPAWSPDGSRIAYVDASRLAVVNADGSGAKRLTAEGATVPAWSPDSKRIAFAESIMNADGTGRRSLIAAGSTTPQWAPGSAIVVGDDVPESGGYPRSPGIRLVSPVDGKARKIAPVLHSRAEIRDTRAGRLIKRFTIDGHTRAAALGPGYLALLVDHEPGVRIEVYNLNGRLRTATAVPAQVQSLSAAGRSVVFAVRRVIRRMDATSGAVRTLATARRIPVGLTIEGRRLVWAENGRGGARIRALTVPAKGG